MSRTMIGVRELYKPAVIRSHLPPIQPLTYTSSLHTPIPTLDHIPNGRHRKRKNPPQGTAHGSPQCLLLLVPVATGEEPRTSFVTPLLYVCSARCRERSQGTLLLLLPLSPFSPPVLTSATAPQSAFEIERSVSPVADRDPATQPSVFSLSPIDDEGVWPQFDILLTRRS